jgi:hypothetical protein
MLLCLGVSTFAASSTFTSQGFSFTPPEGWQPVKDKKPQTNDSMFGSKDELLQAYSWQNGKAYLYITRARFDRSMTNQELISLTADALSKKNFHDIIRGDIKAKNVTLKSVRALDDTNVILKSIVSLDSRTVIVIDFVSSKETFNDVALSLQESLETVEVH